MPYHSLKLSPSVHPTSWLILLPHLSLCTPNTVNCTQLLSLGLLCCKSLSFSIAEGCGSDSNVGRASAFGHYYGLYCKSQAGKAGSGIFPDTVTCFLIHVRINVYCTYNVHNMISKYWVLHLGWHLIQKLNMPCPMLQSITGKLIRVFQNVFEHSIAIGNKLLL